MVASIILLFFIVLNLGIHLAKHGEPRDDKYNFFVAIFVVAAEVLLYYFAGMLENINLATIILFVLLFISICIHLAKHGEYRDDSYNFIYQLIGSGIEVLLYYYAGLFNNFNF